MAINGNIKNYTTTDIERYHRGLLSVKERHDLEKAALDDPFLADALEGYAFAGANMLSDITDLKERLAAKMEGSAVVPMKKAGKTFPWLRVAAMLVLLAGLGVLASQFLSNNKKQNGIAKIEEKKEQSKTSADTGTITSGSVTSTKTANETNNTTTTGTKSITSTDFTSTNKEQPAGIVSESRNREGDVVTTSPVVGSTNVPTPIKANDNKEKQAEKNEDGKNIAASERAVTVNDIKSLANDSDKDGVKDKVDDQQADEFKKKNPVAVSRKLNEERSNAADFYNNRVNNFRGRVTDANNIGLPFARVYNPNDNNAGTYTDVAGNFNLTSTDSVVNVQVKSVGFENTNVQLRSSITDNQVVLQDDRSLSQIVINNQKPNAAARNLNNTMKLEEPEPEDGWDNYDTYLANNLNMPEEIKTKQNPSGQVQVSFEVNADGEPVKIKVEKSLCKKCDKEAIRLIKDGPKWRRTANKKGRTTVTINF